MSCIKRERVVRPPSLPHSCSAMYFANAEAMSTTIVTMSQTYQPIIKIIQVPQDQGTADIFRGIMVSLYVKGKENGHVQAYAPTRAMGLKRWGGLTSKLDGLPIASDPHRWWQACP